jgi:S-formylglutathione hydrolase FrmB
VSRFAAEPSASQDGDVRVGRRWGRVVVALLLVVAAAIGPAPGRAEARALDPRPSLTLVEDRTLTADGRLHDLTVHSPALGREVGVRVLLPRSYDDPAETATRYPVLLLLHGAGGDHQDWTTASALEEHTEDLDLIVVMPDGGASGFYSDWIDGPAWETHHLGEVVPWVDQTYRTRGTREGRAVAGLSMGGFGSMSYAARHPDLFVAAASFSGAVDLADTGPAGAAALQLLGVADDRRWGPYLTHEARWRGHNPPDLASNLRWTRLHLTSGNGVPCPGDRPESSPVEAGTWAMTGGFSTRLTLERVDHHVALRPCGTHEWHHWDAELAAWLPELMATLAAPPPAPTAFDYRTSDASAEVWGWAITTHRPAIEFLDLRAVSPAGLTATGSGVIDLVTAPAFEPGAPYALTSSRAGAVTVPVALVPTVGTVPPGSATTVEAVADAQGRLHLHLDLGPAHTANQYSP